MTPRLLRARPMSVLTSGPLRACPKVVRSDLHSSEDKQTKDQNKRVSSQAVGAKDSCLRVRSLLAWNSNDTILNLDRMDIAVCNRHELPRNFPCP
jgi:hypothetical protein